MRDDDLGYHVFLAEANQVGYTSTGARSDRNDLYRGSSGGLLDKEQQGTILGEYRQFVKRPSQYQGRRSPDCMGISATALWQAHPSHRLDPKFFLFKREEGAITPTGWERLQIKEVMKRRDNIVVPADSPAEMFKVMTISQTGEIRPRQAGKGRNPPEWLGMYFEESSSTWYAAQKGDVVFSSIDLWKGCIAVVPPGFDGALVTKEFPIYQITDDRLDPDFVSAVLRSRYFQRAFRAITTGHSNRRRTQTTDFEELEIVFPPNKSQQAALIKGIIAAREQQQSVLICLKESLLDFSNLIDGRGTEELPSVEEDNEHSADNE